MSEPLRLDTIREIGGAEAAAACDRLDIPDGIHGPVHLFRFTVAGRCPDPGHAALFWREGRAVVAWNADPEWIDCTCDRAPIDCAASTILRALNDEEAVR